MCGRILKTSPQNGSFASGFREIFFPSASSSSPPSPFRLPPFLFGSIPSTGGISSGCGRYAATASSSGSTPMPCRAEPHSTGWICCWMVASRITRWINSSGIGSSGKGQFHQLVAEVVELLKQLLTVKLRLVGEVFRHVLLDDVAGLLAAGEGQQLHPHQVDHAAKRVGDVLRPQAGRDLQHRRPRAEPRLHLVDHGLEVGALAVQLVDERQPRHVVPVRLPPDRLALRLDALAPAEHHHGAVQHPQAPLHLGREVDVPRRVDQVDRDILPRHLHAGGVDGDAALLLFGVVVGGGGALVDLAGPVPLARDVQHPLGDGCLPGIDMGDHANVAELGEVGHGKGGGARGRDSGVRDWLLLH